MKFKVGLIVIATNKYTRFLPQLVRSARKHFLPGQEVSIFALTDREPRSNGVITIPHAHEPWPFPTLKRYDAFLKNAELLKKNDYLFYCDVDMSFADTVGDEILGKSVAVLHPGMYNKPRAELIYETRPASTAYVPQNLGTHYFAGGFQGGATADFLRMSKIISERIARDAGNGIVAVWHDESHFNRYLVDYPPSTILSPSYCYPQAWKVPFPPRIVALNKNHDEIRGLVRTRRERLLAAIKNITVAGKRQMRRIPGFERT